MNYWKGGAADVLIAEQSSNSKTTVLNREENKNCVEKIER